KEETPPETWRFGFGCAEIALPEETDQPIYISGYNQGWEIDGVIDLCQARAAYIDCGGEGVLLIGIDCIALDSGTVRTIRERLSDIENCSINVYATHTHAGPDTLGLWGPAGVNGKNEAYMNNLIDAAEQAARQAVSGKKAGVLHFGKVLTQNMLRDSRYPEVADENLYQLHFSAEDGSAGLRMLFYCAHAESLRGSNRLVSRDYAGLLCDQVQNSTGDDTIFMPGAVGGLLMTKEFVSTSYPKGAQQNLQITADKLTEYALSIQDEREIAPEMAFARNSFTVPLDNPAFALYKFLGILNNDSLEGESATGYHVRSELSVLRMGDIAVALIPGEMFPELAYGGQFGQMNPQGENPVPLKEIAEKFGVKELLLIGLCNDELGYIVPPSDFLLNEENPYLERTQDSLGEDHYEETNSVGPMCAGAIAQAFEKTLGQITK
ncbi:MAG: hypothetical protein IJB41_06680, partial [Clostridia bacterium]|nr:hypothetical protein [Clostridia bacterium]